MGIEEGFNLRRHVVCVDDDLGHAGALEAFEGVGDERLTGDRDEWLGDRLAYRAHACSQARGEHHRARGPGAHRAGLRASGVTQRSNQARTGASVGWARLASRCRHTLGKWAR